MDKDINTFCMRLKEWFAWHFPEMTKIVTDNHTYARVVTLCKANRFNLNDETKEELASVMADEERAQSVIDASGISMGMEMNETDSLQVTKWAERV